MVQGIEKNTSWLSPFFQKRETKVKKPKYRWKKICRLSVVEVISDHEIVPKTFMTKYSGGLEFVKLLYKSGIVGTIRPAH
jgi:hypothetical protein